MVISNSLPSVQESQSELGLVIGVPNTMNKSTESGSYSSSNENDAPHMSQRIESIPFAEVPRYENKGHSPEDLVDNLDPKASGRKHFLGIDLRERAQRAKDAMRMNKPVARGAGSSGYPQDRLNHYVAELPAGDPIQERSRSPPPPDASRSGSNGEYNGKTYVYSYEAGGLVPKTNSRDLNSASSTTADAGLSFNEVNEHQAGPPTTKHNHGTLPALPELPADVTSSVAKDSHADTKTELTRIENDVLRAMMNYPELKGPGMGPGYESTESAVVRILEQYGRISAPMRDSQGRLDLSGKFRKDLLREKDDLRAANTKLQDKLNAKGRELEKLKSTHQQESDALNRQISSLKFQKKEIESSHGSKLRKEKRALQDDIEKLEGQLSRTREDASSDKRELKRRLDKANKAIDDLEASWLKEATEWQQHCNKVENEKADLERSLHKVKSEEQRRRTTMKAEWEDKLLKERQEYEELTSKLRSEINQVKGTLEREKSLKQEELRTQEEVLVKRYEAREVELKTALEEFRVSSARREHFKVMTDSEVARQYKSLANSIDDSSRLEWEYSKEQSWPISDDRIRKLGRNTRKLKQQIVQNTLWLLLYDHVFRSPFKVFGRDGEDHDTDWIPIYSSGASSYEWPEISIEAERIRFETSKAFLKAVEPSASHSDLKASFEASVTNATDAICLALSKVATVQEKDRKNLENAVRLAGKIWLESCSQRYRLIVVLPHGSGDILSRMSADEDNLRLVIRPDLKRYGDSHGKGLMRGEPLAGWKGQVEAYPQ